MFEMSSKTGDVILSGMGSDGTLGLRAIKEKSGGAMVQEPATESIQPRKLRSLINALFRSEFDNYRPWQHEIFSGALAPDDGISADFSQIYLVALSRGALVIPKIFQLLIQRFRVNRAITGIEEGPAQVFRRDQRLSELRF